MKPIHRCIWQHISRGRYRRSCQRLVREFEEVPEKCAACGGDVTFRSPFKKPRHLAWWEQA